MAAFRRALVGAAPATTGHRAIALLAVGTVATAAVLRGVVLSGQRPAPGGEAAAVAQVVGQLRGATFTAEPGSWITPLGRLQLAGLTALVESMGRAPSGLDAVRAGMLVAAIVAVALVWLLARRLEVSPLGAAAGAMVLAFAPLGIAVQRAVLPENLAACWVLGALVAWYGTPPRLWRDLLAVLCAVIAAGTSVYALLVVLVVAAGDRQGRDRVRLLVLLGTAIVLGATGFVSPLRPVLPVAGPGAVVSWLLLDPLVVTALLAAAVIGLWSPRRRAVAVAVLLAAVVTGVTGRSEPFVVVLPAACLLAGAALDRALAAADGRGARHRRADPRRTREPGARWPRVVAGVVAVALVITWIPGYRLISGSRHDLDSVAAAQRWLSVNVPGSRVLADDAGWTELLRAGWPPDRLASPGRCTDRCPPVDWILTSGPDPGPVPVPAAAALTAGSEPVARFAAAVVSRPGVVARPAEQATRARAGAALADSSRITAPADVRTRLRAGDVDPRVLAVLAALAATRPVEVTALPGDPAEDSAGQPRREVLLAAAGDQAQDVVRFFAQQIGVFDPESVRATAAGVDVRYPPGAPDGLLSAFAGP